MRPRAPDPDPDRVPSLMSGREALDTARGGAPATILQRIFGRRRNYLLDTSYQLRSAIVAVLGMGFLLIFAAALFHLLTLERARLLARKAPLLARAAAGSDARSILYLVAVGIVFVVAVFLIEIFETHKTAGVIYKVTRALKEIEGGRWGARVVLRRHDNFKEMEEAFNSAARALRDHLEQDLHGLQGIEGQVRLIAREFESGNREGALVLLRQVAAEMQNLRERKRNLLT